MGLPVLSVHLFAFYYASVAVITPPVGPVAFQTATMAGAPPYRTSVQATLLAVGSFIVPFVWIYWPGLLLMGGPLDIAAGIFMGILSVVALGYAFEGYFMSKLSVVERVLLALGTFCAIFGNTVVVISGIVVVLAVLLLNMIRARSKRLPKAGA
jgi:TRAP-type uncharacterized transport system fused permease subunit